MTQKTALILTTALTVFMIIVATALALRVSQPTTPIADAAPIAVPVTEMPTTVPPTAGESAATPPVTLSPEEVLQREALYRQRLAEANAQLEAAYTQMRQLQQQLQQLQEQNNLLLQREQLYQQRLQEANRLLAQGGQATQASAIDSGLPASQEPIPSAPSSPPPSSPVGDTSISPEQAAWIAQSYVGGGNVHEVELKNKYGVTAYKVEVGGYEVYIDAYTGQIVFSKNEHDEDHDD